MTRQLLLFPDHSPIEETPEDVTMPYQNVSMALVIRPPVAIIPVQPVQRERGRYALPSTPDVIYLPCKATQALEIVTMPYDTVTQDNPTALTRETGKLVDTIIGVSKGDKFWGIVASCFEQMEIAEDEIAAGMRRVWATDKEAAARAWGCFRTCQTKFSLNDILFRAHCKEIVQRAIDNKLHFKKDREPATVAELLHVMVQTSLATPLNEQGGRLYWELFKTALPDAYQKIARSMSNQGMRDSEWLPREDFRGATAQLMADLQHKYGWDRHEANPRLPENPDVLRGILHA